MDVIQLSNVTKNFGGVKALDNVSINVKKNEKLGIIGPNGSGKTTLLNIISGIYGPSGGSVYLKGEKINDLRPHQIARRGVARTFQLTLLFDEMSVLENMLVCGVACTKLHSNELRAEALRLLEFVGLAHLKDERAGNLSGGQGKLLEFARAAMSKPDVFILDEPYVGVHPDLKEKFSKSILSFTDKTFIIVSHDLPSLFNMCDRIVALDRGMKVSEGTPSEIQKDAKVIEAYLGV